MKNYFSAFFQRLLMLLTKENLFKLLCIFPVFILHISFFYVHLNRFLHKKYAEQTYNYVLLFFLCLKERILIWPNI